MASSYTTNGHIELQGTGDNAGTWGSELNTGSLTIIDNLFGNVQTVSLSSTDVTLNTAQTQVNFIKLTGVLSANVNVIFPAIGRTYFVQNATTGNFTASLKIGSGTAVIVPQGTANFYTLDAADVFPSSALIGTATSLASASTTDLGLVGTHNVNITGTTGITSFGSTASAASPLYLVTFASTPTLTHSSSLLLPDQANLTATAGAYAWMLYLGSGNWRMLSYHPAGQAAFPIFGNGRLVYTSSSVVTLTPFQGNLVTFPSGVTAKLPSGGIGSTINNAYINGTAGQTLTSNTFYFAYLWNQGSAASPNFVIDWSTTGHTADTSTGIEVKIGDATRVLVGAVDTLGGIFSDSVSNRLVASWFNRRPRNMLNAFTNYRSTFSTSYIELNSEIRCNFVTWGDAISATFSGATQNNTATTANFGGPSIDGSTSSGSFVASEIDTNSSTTYNYTISATLAAVPSEGFHYLTYMAKVSGGTGQWANGSGQAQLTGVVVI